MSINQIKMRNYPIARGERCVVTRTRGFTVIEMLIVVAMLAALTTVAMRMLEPVAQQSRYDATLRTLQEIRSAVAGKADAGSSNTDQAISGFVADVGRPPYSLHELFANDNPTLGNTSAPAVTAPPLFDIVPAGDTNQNNHDVMVARGWRGPYLQLPPGATSLVDGWGRALVPIYDPAHHWLIGVTSLGGDGVNGGTTSTTADLSASVTSGQWHGAMISGKVYKLSNNLIIPPDNADTIEVKVKLFGPDATGQSSSGICEHHVIAKKFPDIAMNPGETVQEITYQFDSPTIGPRVLRVEIDGAPMGPPVPIIVKPGASMVVDLRVGYETAPTPTPPASTPSAPMP